MHRDQATDAIALDFLQSKAKLPSLPTVGMRLLNLAQQPIEQIDINAFSRLIESDPGLAAKVLQLANSAYYGTRCQITSLRQAIVHIGLEEAINSVHWLFYQRLLPKFPVMEGLSGKAYWAHSWACAQAARMLGHPDHQVYALPGELYVAGLLHGIGKLILALHKPEEFRQCLCTSREFSQPLDQAELELFATTDCDIAYRVLQAWRIPDNICTAVRYYRNPEQAEPGQQEIAALTQFAYYLANISGVGNSGDEFCFDLQSTWLARHSSSPLADPQARQGIVEQILSTLRNKATILSEEKPRTPGADSSASQPGSALPRSRFSSPTLLQRFFSWLRSLLG